MDRGAPDCAGSLCLTHHFRGRTDCPYGNQDASCETPDGEIVTADVSPQLLDRAPETAVICSCRCGGPDPEADYCACPSGFECRELVHNGLGSSGVAGSYCVEAGTFVEDAALLSNDVCYPGGCD